MIFRNKIKLNIRLISFSAIFIFVTILYGYQARMTYSFLDTKNIFDKYLLNKNTNNKTLVVTDSRLAETNLYYYSFRKPANYEYINWENLKTVDNKIYGKYTLYLLIDKNEINFLSRRYKTYIPKFFINPPSSFKKIIETRNTSFYKVDSLEAIKNSY